MRGLTIRFVSIALFCGLLAPISQAFCANGRGNVAERSVGTSKAFRSAGYIISLNEPGIRTFAPNTRSEALTARIRALETGRAQFLRRASELRISSRIRGSVKNLANAFFATDLTREEQERLEQSGYRVTPNYIWKLNLNRVASLVGAQAAWSQLDDTGVPLAGFGVRVGILDSGIDYTHRDFGSCTTEQVLNKTCRRVTGGYDYVSDDPDPRDELGHGTAVAGIIGSEGTLRGIAPASSLLAYRVCDNNGECPVDRIMRALDAAADPNGDGDTADQVHVLNLSFSGGGSPDDPCQEMIDNAVASGIVVVTSAGNGGPHEGSVGCSACSRQALAVGATFASDYPMPLYGLDQPRVDEVVPFSARGPVMWNRGQYSLAKPDLVAPGAIICTTLAANGTFEGSFGSCRDPNHLAVAGSSFSAPVVSGAAALLRQRHPQWSAFEIRAALTSSARRLADVRNGGFYSPLIQGSGRLDVFAAVNLLSPPPLAVITVGGIQRGVTIPIYGSATGNGFESFLLEGAPAESLREASEPRWLAISEGSTERRNTLLGELHTDQFPDGDYVLRLTARTQDGVAVAYGFITVQNFAITSPVDVSAYRSGRTVVGPGERIPVRGVAIGANSYTLEWCDFFGFCSSDGMSLANNAPSTLTTTGILGELDTSAFLASDRMTSGARATIRLTATMPDGNVVVRESTVQLESSLRSVFAAGAPNASDPATEFALADINGDAHSEIIFGQGQTLTVVNLYGEPLPGWPKQLELASGPGCSGRPRRLSSPPAVGNILLNESGLEIAIGDSCGGIHLYTARGTRASGFPARVGNSVESLSLGDLIDNSGYEIIAADASLTTTAIDQSGRAVPGWPVKSGPEFREYQPDYVNRPRSTAVYKVPLQRGSTVVTVAGRSDCTSRVDCLENDSRVTVWTRDGKPLSGWPRDFSGNIGGVVVADVDGNRSPDISFARVMMDQPSLVYVHSLSERGVELPGSPFVINVEDYLADRPNRVLRSTINDRIAAGDINGDDTPELLVPAWGCLFAISRGGVMAGWPRCENASEFTVLDHKLFTGEPTVGDIGLPPGAEITAPVGQTYQESVAPGFFTPVLAYTGAGQDVASFPRASERSPSQSLGIADLNGDGYNELVALEGDRFKIYTTDGRVGPLNHWTQAGGNAARTNFVPPIIKRVERAPRQIAKSSSTKSAKKKKKKPKKKKSKKRSPKRR